MKCKRKNGAKWCSRLVSGMTLVELLVGLGAGSLALMSISVFFVTSNRSFVSMGNYVAMDQASRNAVECMTRDIRNSQDLTSFTTNQLVFTYSGTTNLVYTYNPTTRQLTSWKTGGATNTLLTQCDSLRFSMFSNNPQPGAALTNAASVSQAKAVSAAWRCSRTILGTKLNTENMQESLIVIRKKTVS